MKLNRSILIIALILSLSFGISYGDNSSAELLNELNLLKGDGNSYNLDGMLKRSEAAAFIVKFVGKENEVLQNKDSYIISNFNDLDSKEWYMPYIGYCYKNGIIKGYPDGTFKPTDYVSEKAFLMMLISSMDFKVDDDFSWDDVYRKAYEVGLYEDISYAVRIDDNIDFNRGDVVNLLHNSLTLNMKDGKKTPIDRLIERGIVSLSFAESKNLIKTDKIVTSIKEFKLIDLNSFIINLNESIESIDQIMFYRDDILIDSPQINIIDDQLKFTLINPIENFKSYKIVLKNIMDKDSNLVEEFSQNFEGPKATDYEVSEFNIKAIKPVSDNLIEVYFSNPITDESEQVLLYKFGKANEDLVDGSFKNIQVKRIPNVDNAVYIKFLDSKISSSYTYDLFVRGDLKSGYDLYMGEGEGDTYRFSGSDKIMESFYVNEATYLDNRHVSITFNRAFDKNSAKSISSYILKDLSNGAIIRPDKVFVENTDSELFEVVIRFPSLNTSRSYAVEVSRIYDVFNSDLVGTYTSELGYAIDSGKYPQLNRLLVLNKGIIALDFDMELSELSNSAAISIDRGTTIVKKMIDPSDSKRLLLYLSQSNYLKDNTEYKINISSGIRDIYERSLKTRIEMNFIGISETIDSPQISLIKKMGNYYYIEFSDYIREQELVDISNYEFEVKTGSLSKRYLPSKLIKIDDKSIFISTDVSYEGSDTYIIVKSIYNYPGQVRSINLIQKLD
ncbi:MAG: S-layer homology domain-containing protein [Acidaminobacteraceae bacterium]